MNWVQCVDGPLAGKVFALDQFTGICELVTDGGLIAIYASSHARIGNRDHFDLGSMQTGPRNPVSVRFQPQNPDVPLASA